jgi:hypothetical protein
MQKLPDFEEAKTRLAPKEYRQHLEAVDLSALLLDAVSASAARPDVLDTGRMSFTVQTEFPRIENEETPNPELIVDCVAQVLAGRRQAFRIKATYRLQFTAPSDLPVDFFSIYARVSANMQVWPFLRELIFSTTCRMGLPPFVLPLRIEPDTRRARQRAKIADAEPSTSAVTR